jgi:hypothetical protein
MYGNLLPRSGQESVGAAPEIAKVIALKPF